MKTKITVFGLLLMVSAILLRGGSYVMQYAPVEFAGFGLTIPFDVAVFTTGVVGLMLAHAGFLLSQIARFYSAYRDMRHPRRDDCRVPQRSDDEKSPE